MSDVIAFGYGSSRAEMQLKRLNRHGIIAGATGTGKDRNLKGLGRAVE